MALTLKESPFESEMAIAPPLVCGMTPLGTAVSSARQPLWGLSGRTTAGELRLHLLQIVLEDMAIICRVRHVTEIPNEGDVGPGAIWHRVTGIGGNNKVIWLTGWTGFWEPPNTYRDGRLYDIDPRDFTVRRSVVTPSVFPDSNRPLWVAGDDHTVWVYNPGYSGDRRIYKMSAVDFAVQRSFASMQIFSLGSGDRDGVWAVLGDSNYPAGQQVRLVFHDADFVRQVDVVAPLFELGPAPAHRRLREVLGVGGKDPTTGRHRALICKTYRDDEGARLQLLDANDFSVLRSTLEFRGQYGVPAIGGSNP